MYCNRNFLLQSSAHAHVWWKAIAIFRYFVIIILYCKSIHLWFFSTRYIFYSIYFIIKFNIELIFDNTSIIEYWFFSDVEYFIPRIAPPVSILLLLYFKRYSEINLQQNKGIHFLYCKQNRHFYLDLSSEKYGTPLLY